MYGRILVPLDGSDLAAQVLPYVKSLAQKLQSPVQLLRVMEPVPQELTDSAHGEYPHRVADSLRSHAQDYLEQVAGQLRELGLEVHTGVHEGQAAQTIISEAERDPDTIIAMCTHGRTGLVRWTLGSVADKVLGASTAPLLLVRAAESPVSDDAAALNQVIVPLDGSDLAEGILPHISPLARRMELKVILLRVTASPEEYYRFMDYPVGNYEDLARDVDALAVDYLKQVSARLQSEGVSQVEERLAHGHAASNIIDFAKNTPNNLVAMGTHGRSGVGRWLLGSVTDQVVQHSEDPVLVIRSGN